MSPRKEPHYFNSASLPSTPTLVAYEALFAGVHPHHEAVGEASTHYLFAAEAVPGILDCQPGARFIVCLRNPVQMAPALQAECLAQGWEDEPDFGRAWALQRVRRGGDALPVTVRGDPLRLQYGAYCRLGQQLQRLYTRVSRDRVLPLLLDDLRADPQQLYRKTLAFLDVTDDGRDEFPVVNAAARTRWPSVSRAMRRASQLRGALGMHGDWGLMAALRRLNSSAAPRPPLSPAMTRTLRDHFADDVALLSKLLGRDLCHWR